MGRAGIGTQMVSERETMQAKRGASAELAYGTSTSAVAAGHHHHSKKLIQFEAEAEDNHKLFRKYNPEQISQGHGQQGSLG